jgi:leucyl-tRNA synthetase
MVTEKEVLIVLQVNGKVRDRVTVPAGQSEDDLARLARENPRVRASLDGGAIKMIKVVPDRLVNVVTEKR